MTPKTEERWFESKKHTGFCSQKGGVEVIVLTLPSK